MSASAVGPTEHEWRSELKQSSGGLHVPIPHVLLRVVKQNVGIAGRLAAGGRSDVAHEVHWRVVELATLLRHAVIEERLAYEQLMRLGLDHR